MIKSKFPFVETINVWGGEENVPPAYGSVFLCIKPRGKLFLSSSEKDVISREILGDKKIVTTSIQYKDPSYLYVIPTIKTFFNAEELKITPSTLVTSIRSAIREYNSMYLNMFDGSFKYSKFQRYVDGSDFAVTNSLISIKARRLVDIQYNINADIFVDVGNKIKPGTVTSTIFTTVGAIQEVSFVDVQIPKTTKGDIWTSYTDGETVFRVKKVGTIDYDRGLIDIKRVFVSSSPTNFFIDFIPQENDINTVRNQIVLMDEKSAAVSVVANAKVKRTQ